MPKLVHTPPKYRRHRASGQAVVTINGRDYYLGKWRSKDSRVAYQRVIGEWLAGHGRSPGNQPETDLTITELAARYWRYAKTRYIKTGVHPGIKVALRFLRKYYGDTMAVEFGPLALAALQNWMVEAGHSRPYINSNISHLKRVFKWAVSQQMIPVTVHQALQTVPGLKKGQTTAREPDRIEPVPDAVVEATIPYLPPIVADMVRLHRLTGCRPTELCIIRPCDVDIQKEVWCYTPESHKTEHLGRQRKIFIGPRAQIILRPYLLRDHQSYCFSPKESRRRRHAKMRDARKTSVQPSQFDRSKRRPKREPGERYTSDSYNRAIRRACERAGVPTWHPNQLRHSVATMLRREVGIEAAQVVLGHSNLDTTKIYAERDFNQAEAITRKYG